MHLIIYFSDHETSGRISDRSIEWNGRQGFPDLIPIIGLIFPVGKKGQLGKKILFHVLQVFRLSQLSTNISYKPYLVLRHQLLCSLTWLPESNKSDRNRTGDSIGHLASLNSIPPTWRSFVYFIQIIQYTIHTAKFTFKLLYFTSELSGFMGIEQRSLIL